MDPRTGKIYNIEREEQLKDIETALGRKLIPLDEKTAKKLIPLSKRKRRYMIAHKLLCNCGSKKPFKKCCYKKHLKQDKKNAN